MRVGLFSSENWIDDLPPHVRQAILERSTISRVDAGEELYAAGSTPKGIYQVVEGFLRLTGLRDDGGQLLITVYAPGNCFAETAVVARRALHHTTQAMTPTAVRCLPRAHFWDLYREHPEISDALCRKFAAAIGRQIASRELGTSGRLGQRVALIFQDLAQRAGHRAANGRIEIELPLTQQDIADNLGVTRQSIQREIRDLKAAHLIKREHRRWFVEDLATLKRLAEGPAG